MGFEIYSDFEKAVKMLIEGAFRTLPLSYPCEVISVKDNAVEVKTLLRPSDSDTPTIIPILESPYLTLPIKVGDIGLALNCSYLFSSILEGKEIQENILSQGRNGLFFIPLVKNNDLQNDRGSTTLTSQGGRNKVELREDGITIEGDSSIEIKTGSTSLGEILGGICEALLNANLDPVAGNGAPLSSPTLASKMPELIAKINGSFL